MPETLFTVRWPDGAVETCYSPSTIIKDYIQAGRGYALAEFLDLCRGGLNAASARVGQIYGGGGCSRAMAQLAAIEATAKQHAGAETTVRVESFETR
jgi:uncharacterized repeat protein (TIGR04042 family)